MVYRLSHTECACHVGFRYTVPGNNGRKGARLHVLYRRGRAAHFSIRRNFVKRFSFKQGTIMPAFTAAGADVKAKERRG